MQNNDVTKDTDKEYKSQNNITTSSDISFFLSHNYHWFIGHKYPLTQIDEIGQFLKDRTGNQEISVTFVDTTGEVFIYLTSDQQSYIKLFLQTREEFEAIHKFKKKREGISLVQRLELQINTVSTAVLDTLNYLFLRRVQDTPMRSYPRKQEFTFPLFSLIHTAEGIGLMFTDAFTSRYRLIPLWVPIQFVSWNPAVSDFHPCMVCVSSIVTLRAKPLHVPTEMAKIKPFLDWARNLLRVGGGVIYAATRLKYGELIEPQPILFDYLLTRSFSDNPADALGAGDLSADQQFLYTYQILRLFKKYAIPYSRDHTDLGTFSCYARNRFLIKEFSGGEYSSSYMSRRYSGFQAHRGNDGVFFSSAESYENFLVNYGFVPVEIYLLHHMALDTIASQAFFELLQKADPQDYMYLLLTLCSRDVPEDKNDTRYFSVSGKSTIVCPITNRALNDVRYHERYLNRQINRLIKALPRVSSVANSAFTMHLPDSYVHPRDLREYVARVRGDIDYSNGFDIVEDEDDEDEVN